MTAIPSEYNCVDRTTGAHWKTVWECEPPLMGQSFTVLKEAWNKTRTVHTILAIALAEGPDAQTVSFSDLESAEFSRDGSWWQFRGER